MKKMRRSVSSGCGSHSRIKYDKDKQYYLVVYDEESGLDQWRQPVIMDIAFADDFGF